MIYGLLTTKSTLVFTILLIIVYFPKAKKIEHNSTATKAYKACIIAEASHFFLQIISMYALKITGQSQLYKVLYVLSFCSMTFMLPCWIYNIRATIDDIKDLSLFQMIKYSTETKICAIMPLSSLSFLFSAQSNKMLTDIPADNIAFYNKNGLMMIGVGIIFVLMYTMYLVYKNREKLTKEYKQIQIISFVGLAISVLIQVLIPKFAIFEFGMLLVLYAYYFLQENPDILIKKQIQLTETSAQNNSDFLSNIPSNIKLPLNKIQEAYIEINNTRDYELIKKNIKIINESGNEFIDIVNNVIESSQTGITNNKIQERKYETKELLKEIINYTTEKIGEKKVQLVMRVNPTVSSVLYGDYNKVKQSILNVINYACQNTDLGKIIITLSSSKNNDMELLTFKISDTGHGIKESEKEDVFKEGNTKTVLVTSARNNIMSIGGTVWFESIEEAGTKFYIQITQKIMDLTQIGDIKELLQNKINTNTDFSKYRVLVVDDNTLNAKITKHYLDKYKFNTELSYSGKDCINKIKSGEEYDAIFLDITMPELNGVETLNVLDYLEETIKTKVIAVSANSLTNTKEEYLSYGFDEYIEKPIKKQELESILNKYFNK